jgi:hypothetical protein
VVLIVGLVSQRVGDLLQIDAAQIKHHARISPVGPMRARTGTPNQRQKRKFTPSVGDA